MKFKIGDKVRVKEDYDSEYVFNSIVDRVYIIERRPEPYNEGYDWELDNNGYINEEYLIKADIRGQYYDSDKGEWEEMPVLTPLEWYEKNGFVEINGLETDDEHDEYLYFAPKKGFMGSNIRRVLKEDYRG